MDTKFNKIVGDAINQNCIDWYEKKEKNKAERNFSYNKDTFPEEVAEINIKTFVIVKL